MKKQDKLIFSSRIGFLFTAIFGSINHFIYKLSGRNPIIGAFVSVNESTWEHMKLLFFPYLIYTTAEWLIYGRKIDGFFFSRITGILIGLFMIPAIFYVYTGILGRNFAVVDILIFFAADAAAFYTSSRRIIHRIDHGTAKTISAVVIAVCLAVLFIGFTFFPPDSPLFRSPV